MRRVAVYVIVAIVLVAAFANLGGGPAAPPTAQAGDDPSPIAAERSHATEPSDPDPTPTARPRSHSATPASHAPSAGDLTGLTPTGPTEVATVASVTDGDTIRVILDGENVPVRYIGIDTPETHNGLEWMGPEAADANAALVEGRQVVLEKDVSETDRFGRLLRYVWLHDGSAWLLVNLELLRQGYAQVATFPPDVKWIDPWFLDAQAEAREAGLGLWGPGPEPTPAAIQPLVPGAGGDCEPSYPTICIPIGVADIDCGDIDARRFPVRWDVPNPDPHRFDGEHDGIGCES